MLIEQEVKDKFKVWGRSNCRMELPYDVMAKMSEAQAGGGRVLGRGGFSSNEVERSTAHPSGGREWTA